MEPHKCFLSSQGPKPRRRLESRRQAGRPAPTNAFIAIGGPQGHEDTPLKTQPEPPLPYGRGSVSAIGCNRGSATRLIARRVLDIQPPVRRAMRRLLMI